MTAFPNDRNRNLAEGILYSIINYIYVVIEFHMQQWWLLDKGLILKTSLLTAHANLT